MNPAAPAPHASAPPPAANLPPETDGLDPAEAEGPEFLPGAAVTTPMWLVGLFGLMLYWATLYLDRNGGGFHPLVFNQGELLADLEARVPRSEADALLALGRRVYERNCSACHQPNGRGVANQFPPLAGSDWVLTEGPNRIIRIVLNGLQGPITVNGNSYNNVMVPWRDQLSDEEIAAVVTFIRGNPDWGNNAGPATAAQVAAIRQATANRATYWTAPELLALPAKD